MDILNHRLVDCEAVHLTCPKNVKLLKDPDVIVLHYTAGRNARMSANYLIRSDVKASTHLIIGRDGKIIQLVPFNVVSWHAGISCFRWRTRVNDFSIGIELDNLGKLHRVGERFVAACGAGVMPSDVYADYTGEVLTYWHKYTDCQLRRLTEVVQLLTEVYPIRHVVRHSDITSRKIDPGPAFPDELIQQFHGSL